MADFGVTEVLLIASVAAAAASAYGTYEGYKAQEEAADYNKKVAENRAALARQQAEVDAATLEEKNKRLEAMQLTAQGASGIEVEAGSPLLVRADTARQMQRDVYLTRVGGEITASGYEQQGELYGLYARQSSQAANVGAGVSLLSSGAQIGGQYAYGRYGGYSYGNPYVRSRG